MFNKKLSWGEKWGENKLKEVVVVVVAGVKGKRVGVVQPTIFFWDENNSGKLNSGRPVIAAIVEGGGEGKKRGKRGRKCVAGARGWDGRGQKSRILKVLIYASWSKGMLLF